MLVPPHGFKKTAQIKSGSHTLKQWSTEFQLKLTQVHPLQNELVRHSKPLRVSSESVGLQGDPGWALESCQLHQVNAILRNIQTCEAFLVSLFEPNWQLLGSKTSTGWDNATENGRFASQFIHYNQKRWGKWVTWNPMAIEKQKEAKGRERNLWDWIKSKIRHFYIGGYRTDNSQQLTR